MFSASLTFPNHPRCLLLPHSAPPASPPSSNSLAHAGLCTSASLFPLPGNLFSLKVPRPAPSLPVPAQSHQSSPLTSYVKQSVSSFSSPLSSFTVPAFITNH